MAVYEHSYKPYEGELTPDWARFLIIPRHAYSDVFRSKLFTGFFALCFVCPLVMAILIYLHHNVTAMAMFSINLADLVPINERFFTVYMGIQSSLAFLLTVLIGPVLVSRDLTNNALPLYLCRPFTRTEYVVGKMSVLAILISFITWVPGLLLFLFNSYLNGAGWFAANIRIGSGLFLASWVTIIVYALLSMAISAWVKWRIAASAALFGFFIISNVVSFMINGLFRTKWGSLFNLSVAMQTIQDNLLGDPNSNGYPDWMVLPVPAAWVTVLLICAFCLLLISQRIKAYEVVR
jgi:ABC-2 type transport system permease protein